MRDDDVPSDEMRWLTSDDDPIDAVLGDDPVDDDLLDVAVVVHDIRAAYLPAEPLRREPGLAAFTDAHLDVDGGDTTAAARTVPPAVAGAVARHTKATGRKRTKMLSSIGGFLGTLTGKAVLGTAIAAATVGGIHAADMVDVPMLPANDRSAAEAPAGESEAGHASDPSADAGTAGQLTAAQKRAAAEAHAQAVQRWTDCVAEAAADRSEADTPAAGAFDPRDVCGAMPQPGDFGLTDLPSQASAAAVAGDGSHDAPAMPERPGSAAPDVEGPAPAGADEAPDAPPAAAPTQTQPGTIPGDQGSATPPGGPESAPADGGGAGQHP